jgi:hypothetical protein
MECYGPYHHHHHHHQWLYSPCKDLGRLTPEVSVILERYLVGLLWTSDQPVAKASTYTERHNTETQRQTSMPRVEFEHTIPVTKRPRPTH